MAATATGQMMRPRASWNERLHLFPPPVDWILGRSLHFVARLDRS